MEQKQKIPKIRLNHLGQFYASKNRKDNPGVFGITVNLKEKLSPELLQSAFDSLMRRFPFVNVRLCSGFMWFYHKPLKTLPKIISENDMPAMCCSFENKRNHLIRIIYGERCFTVEAFHSICDGRSLAVMVNYLLDVYFGLAPVSDGIDRASVCSDFIDEEEMEDAYFRWADNLKPGIFSMVIELFRILGSYKKAGEEKIIHGYIPDFMRAAAEIITQKFDLVKIKQKAKEHGVTVNEYIMAHMFLAFAAMRDNEGSNKPVIIEIAVDCRKLFPSRSIFPFAVNATFTMPETKDFSTLVHSIKEQLINISAESIKERIKEIERMINIGNILPLFIKKHIMGSIGNSEIAGCTTWFSNLGLIQLPAEIEARVDSISFALCPETAVPYQFGCASIGDTLTLTTSATVKEREIIDHLANALNN